MKILDIFRRRRHAYRDLFAKDDPNVRKVLADLKRFCRYQASTFSEDANRQSYLNGRRDVLERILGFVHFTEDEIRNMKEDS